MIKNRKEIFNPFNKNFKDVKEEDLEILKEVQEGWYVEYKKEMVKGKAIAKVVSSLANSYGGIFFIGIEMNKENNCAYKFSGINDSPDIIRDSVRNLVQPFPYFETLTIPLKNGNYVLMILIPEGNETPYIHSDGKIYRRQEAGSDPICIENNRHIVDELYSKSGKIETEKEDFRKSDLTFCEEENETPYLEIYINTLPFRNIFIDDLLNEKHIESILNHFNEKRIIEDTEISKKPMELNYQGKFDSINYYHESICLRYLNGSDLAYNNSNVEIDVYGNLKLLIPINFFKIFGDESNLDHRLIDKLSESVDYSSLKFLENRSLFGSVFGLIDSYILFLKKKGFEVDFECKLRLENCWRTILYFDSEHYFEYIKKYGLPICMKSEQYFPRKSYVFSMKKYNESPLLTLGKIFQQVCLALGINSGTGILSFFNEISNNPEEFKK